MRLESQVQQAAMLADLEPDFPFAIALPQTKLSAHPLGSFRQRLRRPARMPDFFRAYAPGDPVNRNSP